MRNGYRKNSLCLRAASALKWSVFSQFFTELHTTLLKDPNKTKSGLWELTEALKRLLLALLHSSTEIEKSVSLVKTHPSHPVWYIKNNDRFCNMNFHEHFVDVRFKHSQHKLTRFHLRTRLFLASMVPECDELQSSHTDRPLGHGSCSALRQTTVIYSLILTTQVVICFLYSVWQTL